MRRHVGEVELEMVPVESQRSLGVGGFVGETEGEAREMLMMEGCRDREVEVLSTARFKRTSWPSRVFRVVYIAPLGIFWVVSVLYAMPGPWQEGRIYTFSSYVAVANAVVSFTSMLVIYVYYAVRFGCRSTVIPCVGKMWFKALLGVAYVLILVTIIVTALETRRTPCGIYSTSRKDMDRQICAVYERSGS